MSLLPLNQQAQLFNPHLSSGEPDGEVEPFLELENREERDEYDLSPPASPRLNHSQSVAVMTHFRGQVRSSWKRSNPTLMIQHVEKTNQRSDYLAELKQPLQGPKQELERSIDSLRDKMAILDRFMEQRVLESPDQLLRIRHKLNILNQKLHDPKLNPPSLKRRANRLPALEAQFERSQNEVLEGPKQELQRSIQILRGKMAILNEHVQKCVEKSPHPHASLDKATRLTRATIIDMGGRLDMLGQQLNHPKLIPQSLQGCALRLSEIQSQFETSQREVFALVRAAV